MKTKIQQARDEGYSDEEIFNYLSKSGEHSDKIQKATQEGFKPSEIVNYLHEKELPGKAKSIGSAALKGLIKGTNALSSIKNLGLESFGLAPKGPVTEEQGQQLLQENLPSRDERAEQIVGRGAELLPQVLAGPESLALKGAQLGAGTLLGQLGQENDVGALGQGVLEAAGISLPGFAKGAIQKVKNLFKTAPEKLPSGLTKPAAIEAKKPSLAVISPERQEKAIASLNEEASKLAKATVQKELPIAKKIEEGFDFEGQYEKKFGQLRRAANDANPEIDITPVSKFLSQEAKKYKNIPNLHPEGKKVIKEIAGLRNNPQTELKNLLKIYRSNNQKIRNIYETSRLKGSQKEYVDFLVDLNRNIAKSFEDTLPKDSAWVKTFKDMNADYRNFKNATKTLGILEPILNRKATPASLEKLATDKKMQAKLKLAMGEKGAEEISMLARDLKDAVASLKKISSKELKFWEYMAPLSIFVPGTYGIGTAFGAHKAVQLGKRGYGYLLTNPQKRREYKKVLEAIINKDPEAYQKAVTKLLTHTHEEQSD